MTLLNLMLANSLLSVVTTVQSAEENVIQKGASHSISPLANPNWWKKSPFNSDALMKKSQPKVDYNLVRSEPLSNFLLVGENTSWQQVSGSVGVSSVKYQLDFEGKTYELAIIRMDENVPLPSVLNIWQNKVGLSSSSASPVADFKTENNQKLAIYSFKGQQKSILLATHKQDKYTFFRLLGEQGIDENVAEKFRVFLAEVTILPVHF